MTYSFDAEGFITFLGTEAEVAADSTIQIVDDTITPTVTATVTFTTAAPITGVLGTFLDGEALVVIGDNLVVNGDGNAVIGNIQVMGVTSGATGIVAIPTNSLAWSANATVSVTSSALISDVANEEIEVDFDLSATNFSPSEYLIITGWALAGDADGKVVGDITFEGDTSGVTETFTIETGIGDSGVFAEDEVINVADYRNLIANETEEGYTPAVTDASMFRLLLHEDDNVWEPTPRNDMVELYYSQGSNILWTIVDPDSGTDSLVAFEDFVSGMVQDATAVEVDKSPGTATKKVKVSWTHLKGAWEYKVKFTDGFNWYVADFNPVAAGVQNFDVPAKTEAGDTLSAVISGLDPATEYYFFIRVDVQQPYMSRWSAPASVVTDWHILPPVPQVPAQGLQNAPLLPSFVWEAASGAVSYDFQLSTSPSFDSKLVDINITDTGYTCTVELAYDTNHYWRVRAVAADDTVSSWCTIQNFHTRTEEQPPVTIPPYTPPEITVTMDTPIVTVNIPDITVESPDVNVNVPPVVTVTENPPATYVLPKDEAKTPVYIWIIVAIGAVLTIAVIVLIIRTRRVV
jgi:hypothetical protein